VSSGISLVCIFTARLYASAVYRSRLSVRHKPVLYQNGRTQDHGNYAREPSFLMPVSEIPMSKLPKCAPNTSGMD